MNNKRNVLVVAAHPDDEVLGCGGTIAKHVHQGDEVHVLILTNGVGARVGMADAEAMARRKMAEKAAKTLGVKSVNILDFPDNGLDQVPLLDVIKAVEVLMIKLHPHAVYTHHGGDLNIDHQIAHRAVMTACRPQPGCSVREIFSFEVMSSTEWSSSFSATNFVPTVFVDVTDFVLLKRAALEAYKAEMREFPHSRSFSAVDALMQYRGSTVGVNAAEVFQAERVIR